MSANPLSDMHTNIGNITNTATQMNIDTKFAESITSAFRSITSVVVDTQKSLDGFQKTFSDFQKDMTTAFSKSDTFDEFRKILAKRMPKLNESTRKHGKGIGEAFGKSLCDGLDSVDIEETILKKISSAVDNAHKQVQRNLESIDANLSREQQKYDRVTSILDGKNPFESATKRRLDNAEKAFNAEIERITTELSKEADELSKKIRDRAIHERSIDPTISWDTAVERAEKDTEISKAIDAFKTSQSKSDYDIEIQSAILSNEKSIVASADRHIDIGNRIYNLGKDVITPLLESIKAGVTKYTTWSSDNWNTIATSGLGGLGGMSASDRIEIGRQTFNNAGGTFSDVRENINYTEDYNKNYVDLLGKGFSESVAATMALRKSILGVITPWADKSIESNTDMMRLMSEDSYNSLIGMSEMIRETEIGNRLVSSGVYGNMLNDMFDTLVNIEWNTGDVTQLPEDMVSIMANLRASNVAKTDQDAYAIAKKILDTAYNPFEAIQSDDIFERIIGSKILQGESPGEAVNSTELANIVESYANAGTVALGVLGRDSQIAATLFKGNYNTNLGADAQAKFVSDFFSGNVKDADAQGLTDRLKESTKVDYSNYLETIIEKIDGATTRQDKFNNVLENFTSTKLMTKWLAENVPYFNSVFGGITGTLGGIVEALIQGHIVKSAIKSATSAEKTVGFLSKMTGMLKTGFSTIGGAIKTGFGKAGSLLKTGFGKVGDTFKTSFGKLKGTSGGAMGTMMGIGGLVWGAVDAYKGIKKADDWFADKNNGKPATTQQKITSGIGGFLGGTSSGLEGALSGAGKGAMIGSFFGPLGTVIGGAVGAGLGAIGGEKISKALDTATDFVVGGTKKAWGAISNFATDAWNKTTDFVSGTYKEVAGKLKSAYNTVSDEVKNGFPKTKEAFKNASDYVKDKVKYVSDNMADSYNKTNDILNDNSKNMFEKASALTTMSVEQVKETASNIQGIWQDDTTSFVSKIGDTYTELASAFGGFISSIQSVKDSLLSVFGKVGGVIKDGFQKTMDDINNGTEESSSAISEGFKGLLESLGQIGGGLFAGGKSLISSAGISIKDALGFKTGLSNTSALFDLLKATSPLSSIKKVVKDEMPIFVHKDEMILNASDAKILRGMYSVLGINSISGLAQYMKQTNSKNAYESLSMLTSPLLQKSMATIGVSSQAIPSLTSVTSDEYSNMILALQKSNAVKDMYTKNTSNIQSESLDKMIKSITEEVSKIINAIYDTSDNPDIQFRNKFNTAIGALQRNDAIRLYYTTQGIGE